MVIMLKFNIKCMKIYKNQINVCRRQQPYLIMHVAMNRVDPVVVAQTLTLAHRGLPTPYGGRQLLLVKF